MSSSKDPAAALRPISRAADNENALFVSSVPLLKYINCQILQHKLFYSFDSLISLYLPIFTDEVLPINTPTNPPKVNMDTTVDQSRVRPFSDMLVW